MTQNPRKMLNLKKFNALAFANRKQVLELRILRKSFGKKMEALLKEYLPILMFLGIALGLACVLVIASYILAKRKPDAEKLSPYECGFAPFEDSRTQFDVRFYLVAILFIIFDLEIAFLFPWAITIQETGFVGFLAAFVFLFILTIGFIYEWRKGALEWE